MTPDQQADQLLSEMDQFTNELLDHFSRSARQLRVENPKAFAEITRKTPAPLKAFLL